LVDHPIRRLTGTMCQHDFQGRRLFQHRNTDKWNLFLRNKVVKDFWLEQECRDYLRQLHRLWDGRAGRYLPRWRNGRRASRGKVPNDLRFTACMISCPERERVRRRTLAKLAGTDWGTRPVLVHIDAEIGR